MKGETQKYILLREAVQYCSYSQEYLSLRARQGRLKALKFGKNWVTTKQWLQDYLQKTKRRKIPVTISSANPPLNLKRPEFNVVHSSIMLSSPKRNIKRQFRLGLTLVLLSLILVWVSKSSAQVFLQDILNNFFPHIASYQFASVGIQDIFQSVLNIFKEYGEWVSQILGGIKT